MKKWLKKIIIIVIVLAIAGVIAVFFSAEKIPEADAYIVGLMSNQYPAYSVKAQPAFLDASIEVTHKDGSKLTDEEIKDVRAFFNTNYSGGYWRGIPQ